MSGNEGKSDEAFGKAIDLMKERNSPSMYAQGDILKMKKHDKFNNKGYDRLIKLWNTECMVAKALDIEGPNVWRQKVIRGCIIAGVASVAGWYCYRHRNNKIERT